MKSLIGFASLSPALLVAFAGCSTSGDTPDEFTGESSDGVAVVGNTAAVNDTYNLKCESDYLVPGIQLPAGLGFRQITMAWDRNHPEAGGSFQIDPNACGLDAFGDRAICTKLAVQAGDMQLSLLAEKTGYRAYTIEARPYGSTDSYSTLPLRLVTIAAQSGERPQMRLLVINADQTINRIVEMH
ncbi:MAG TPA: hypothetical protein VHN14_27580 [Kofleriaceae bacterium]|jgi:hypothetical protein|nr:hypothetical protein [Kofleriaceae bacterium]